MGVEVQISKSSPSDSAKNAATATNHLHLRAILGIDFPGARKLLGIGGQDQQRGALQDCRPQMLTDILNS